MLGCFVVVGEGTDEWKTNTCKNKKNGIILRASVTEYIAFPDLLQQSWKQKGCELAAFLLGVKGTV